MDPFSLKVPFLKVETVFYLLNRIIYLGEAFLESASTGEYIHNSIPPESLVSKSRCIQHLTLPHPNNFFVLGISHIHSRTAGERAACTGRGEGSRVSAIRLHPCARLQQIVLDELPSS